MVGDAVLSALLGAIFGALAGAAAGWIVARSRPAQVERLRAAERPDVEPGGPVQVDLPLTSSELMPAMKASQKVLEELESRYAGTRADEHEEAPPKGRGGGKKRVAGRR